MRIKCYNSIINEAKWGEPITDTSMPWPMCHFVFSLLCVGKPIAGAWSFIQGVWMWLTALSRVLENLTVSGLVKKFSAFMVPKYHVHESPPLGLILSQLNPGHLLAPCFSKIHCNIPPYTMCIPSGCFPSSHRANVMCARVFSVMHLHVAPISSPWFHRLNDIWWAVKIINLIFHCSPSFCLFLPPRSKYSPQLCVRSQTPSILVLPLRWRTKFHVQIKPQKTLKFCKFHVLSF
jgi:hypothetical protein